MEVRQLQDGLWTISICDRDYRGFGAVSYREHGVQYLTYLMETAAGYISFGSVPREYLEEWCGAVRGVAADQYRWAVFFGMDSDRAAARAILKQYPQVTILAGNRGLFQLRCEAGGEFSSIELRGDRRLTFGDTSLSFRVLREQSGNAALYVIDPARHTLFTADAFGSLCAADTVLLSQLEEKALWRQGAKAYLAEIFGQRRTASMVWALDLAEKEALTRICPAQGLILDCPLDVLRALYQGGEKTAAPPLAILYAPGNYVEDLADQILLGAQDSGLAGTVACNLSQVSRLEALELAQTAEACLFGTSEPCADAAKSVWDILTSLHARQMQRKPAALFCSTWSIGDAVSNLRSRLRQLRCDLGHEDLLLQGVPDDIAWRRAYEFGYDLGCYVQKVANPRKPKLVRCLVCGEIFDASLGACPVCGVGLELCVPVDADDSMYRRDTNRSYLILGGGAAAVSAAEAIRLRDQTGKIKILSREDSLPIHRPMLTKDITLPIREPQSMLIHPAEWYQARAMECVLNTRAAEIRPEEKTVYTEDGACYSYDKLIVATGAECFVPPFQGHEKSEVITIRHISDARKLHRLIQAGAKHAVVIGGGVLGLEAANELFRSGLQVTVLEAAPQIIGRQVDRETADRLKKIMSGLGVACYEGVSIAEIEGNPVSSVRLADGRSFPADIVIVSCGNRGNISEAQAAGIHVDRAIVVNAQMETNLPDVYACGDCAQFEGINCQLWQEASNQGRVAGANAAGEPITFANQPLGLSLEGFGTSLFAIGDPGKGAHTPYQTVSLEDEISGRREVYWFFGGRLEGGVAIGAPEKIARITDAVMTHTRYSAFRKEGI